MVDTTANTNDDSDFQLYRYNPSMGAAILFIILFAISSVAIIIFISERALKAKNKLRSWKKISDNAETALRFYKISKLYGAYIPLIVGCIVELIGYIGRAISGNDKEALGPYIMQSVLLLIAPTLYAATIYMLFGRMAHLLFAESLMIMPARFNTLIFVLGDIASLFMQAAGGGLMASADSAKSGSNLVTAGLFVQIAFFGLFIINEFLFIFRVGKLPNPIQSRCASWKSLNMVLIVNSFLILIRSIVRAIEFIEGFDGFIASHEWYLYVFDSLPMYALTVISIATLKWNNIFRIQEESVNAQIHVGPLLQPVGSTDYVLSNHKSETKGFKESEYEQYN
ncbi:Rta1p NDAI_0D02370 [Naumovozyma dairenensis CBS 421]|uniref:Protein RTA1 n=1 Tax=Naumovozyma dairenensis (strain ATCC 10597 / BCRC 20456 / CBS 421 / NBRC 0211 / NRRL Y-12639) TaxID=1071378 RepID=G0W9U0_NAUDC|nr:hypothetical protein NDAI_0D02370 [Naumovozyma dairenensis CBS 421]CCD24551.1 hypothetical protein NDAI_0D02370 [Naumovozyma dairenensis CBS 421]